MNIGKFLNKITGKDKLDAYRQATRYQQQAAAAAPPQPESRPTTTQVTFTRTKCDVPFRLATSEGEWTVTQWEEIGEAPDKDMVTVELGLEEPGNPRTRLVEKDCGQEEVFAIFRAFYQTGDVPNRERYQPVRFFQ